jgi:hypothetical protein
MRNQIILDLVNIMWMDDSLVITLRIVGVTAMRKSLMDSGDTDKTDYTTIQTISYLLAIRKLFYDLMTRQGALQFSIAVPVALTRERR